MSNVYYRFFRVTNGPLMDEAIRILEKRSESNQAIKELGERIGADPRVSERRGLAGFVLPGDADDKDWKQPNSRGLRWPKKNTKAGREIMEAIKALPPRPSVDDALDAVGLPGGHPVLIEGSTGYAPVWWGWPGKGVIFVKVPWRDIPQSELDAYRANEHWGSVEMDHLLWEPHDSLQEIKEWEALRENEDLKSEAA